MGDVAIPGLLTCTFEETHLVDEKGRRKDMKAKLDNKKIYSGVKLVLSRTFTHALSTVLSPEFEVGSRFRRNCMQIYWGSGVYRGKNLGQEEGTAGEMRRPALSPENFETSCAESEKLPRQLVYRRGGKKIQ
jgi:hypothetical protein